MTRMLQRALRIQEPTNSLLSLVGAIGEPVKNTIKKFREFEKVINDLSSMTKPIYSPQELQQIMQARCDLLELKFKRSGKTPYQILGRNVHEWVEFPEWPRYHLILRRLHYQMTKNN